MRSSLVPYKEEGTAVFSTSNNIYSDSNIITIWSQRWRHLYLLADGNVWFS
jgi:hypothetical protein